MSRTSLLELIAQLLLLLAVPWLIEVFKLPPGGCVELNMAAEPLPACPAVGAGPWGAMAPLLGDLPSMRERKLPEASSLPPLLSDPAAQWQEVVHVVSTRRWVRVRFGEGRWRRLQTIADRLCGPRGELCSPHQVIGTLGSGMFCCCAHVQYSDSVDLQLQLTFREMS